MNAMVSCIEFAYDDPILLGSSGASTTSESSLVESTMKPSGLPVLLLLLCSLPVNAQDALARPTLHMVRIDQAPVIDGKLDEPMWQQAAVIDQLHQIRPGNGVPASEPTQVYFYYNKDALFIGARMQDSGAPDEILRSVMRHGGRLGSDDRLAILLDPFNSGRQGYRFEVNANGIRNDMLYQNNALEPEWNVIWETAGSVDDDGWTAEIAIPFKSLPFDPEIDTWGLNVARAIRRRGEETVWVSRNRAWNPSIVGEARGITGIDKGVGLDVVAGLSTTQRKSFITDDSEWDVEPSLEMYYRITPALSASLTINTDFSATEVDDRQVNLSRVGLFFPEKRDFFLNDADLFEFGRLGKSGFFEDMRSVGRADQENGRPFFSRRIGLSPLGTPVDLNYGGKLSGRIGNFNIAALGVRQDEFSAPGRATIDASTIGVTRITANVFGESRVGMVATSGNLSANLNNTLVGADFLYLNSNLPGGRALEVEGWVQQTRTEGLEGEDLAWGVGMRLPSTSALRASLGLREIEKNFSPALGFVSRTDVRQLFTDTGYTLQLQSNLVQSVYLGVDAQRITALADGELITQVIALRPFELDMRSRDKWLPVYTFNTENVRVPFVIYNGSTRRVTVPAGRYQFEDYGLDYRAGEHRRLGGELRYRKGGFYDGERLNIGGTLIWKQSRFLTLRAGYDWNDIQLLNDRFITRLMTTGSEVALSPEWNWITLLQYDDVSEVFGLHSRVVWNPKAGQEVFLVLNRNFQDFDKNNSFTSVASELTAKANYTFRF